MRYDPNVMKSEIRKASKKNLSFFFSEKYFNKKITSNHKPQLRETKIEKRIIHICFIYRTKKFTFYKFQNKILVRKY